MDLSIVIPTFNEQENVEKLHSELVSTLKKINKSCEIIFVDDGSTDQTFEKLERIARRDKKVRIVKFTRNFGQTAALLAGFQKSKGNVIISMDADLQNDPADIPKLLRKLNDGYDVVCGWRANRKDTFGKVLSSKISNWLMDFLMDLNIHDSGCTLRAYKRRTVNDLQIYGETHRYIPAMISSRGFKVAEVPVNHRSRFKGKTKYGLARLPKGLLDLLTLKFLVTYGSRPIHIFGGAGLFLFGLGFLGGLWLAYEKFWLRLSIGNRPLLTLVLLLLILGVLFILNGFVAELLIRTRTTETYKIEKTVN
ncbi:TPA: glycosyltransferase family 2 protein [archaeon]|uniref:Glycosyltransferase family 2 protein n=1 Tax=Candidatus Naiadarchaeum limnaeum TaxID=2756139 RepID=A0A832VAX6_9ARCH|nr:glycosyltransferase family 2 protein [Candidatus Naiadarchaeum limnaeum]